MDPAAHHHGYRDGSEQDAERPHRRSPALDEHYGHAERHEQMQH